MIQLTLPQKKKFIVTSNNYNKYSVELLFESNILIISIKSNDKIPTIRYNNKFSLENIKQLNKYFLSCTSIYEVYILLEPSIQNTNNLSLIEETNEINLIINIPFPLSPQIIFKNKYITKYGNESINELYEIINKQNLQINKQNNKINEQNNKINEQNNKINEQNNKINEQNDKINEQYYEIKFLKEKINKIPIGIIERNEEVIEVYSKEQFKENKKCWYNI